MNQATTGAPAGGKGEAGGMRRRMEDEPQHENPSPRGARLVDIAAAVGVHHSTVSRDRKSVV